LGPVSFQAKIRIGEKDLAPEAQKFAWTGRGGCGNTPAGGKKEGRNGDTVSRTLVGDKRIRYYSSSEKLTAMN
jgi:hypothetical protein